MLHLSDIKKYERCPRYFWLARREQKNMIPYINYNENMSVLIEERLMLKDPFKGKANDASNLALEAFAQGKSLLNARFAYQDLRIKVPVLLRENNQNIMYMSYQSCYPKEREAQYIADMVMVLKKLGITIDEIYAIHLNAAYIREESLDVKQLLLISDRLYNSKNHAHKQIMELVEECLRDIDPWIEELHRCEALDEVVAKRTSNCTRGSKCPFYQDCFHETMEDSSILHLVQSAHKYDMYHQGKKHLRDVDVDFIEGTRHQYSQIMADKAGGIYVDKSALRCWIHDHIQYPISYLDFEWETFAFPPYHGMKPFDVLTFQYSLHIEQGAGKALSHVDFVGEQDCREAFILDLLKHIPKEGSILVYNMEGAEKLRLMQLSQQFPQYEKELRQIWERMVDLSLPFATGNVYDLRMKGCYSLKTLVPIFSKFDYQDLDISYGMDAVEKWRLYSQTIEPQEKAELYRQLTQYCSMDTYAEYIVFHALETLAK